MTATEYFIKTKIKTNGIYWYENKPNTKNKDPKLKALHHCLNNVKENELVIHKSDNRYRKWGIATENELKKMTETDNHIFEVLTEKQKKKVYFDIDINPNLTKYSFTEHLEKCKEFILELFSKANFQITGNESESKYSYHIILSNYVFTNQYNLLKAFTVFYKDYGFDNGVYTINRNMKCINQSKGYKQVEKKWLKDTRIQAYIQGNQQHSKHLITCDFDETLLNLSDLDFSDYRVILKNEKEMDDCEKLRKRLEHKKKGVDILSIKPSKTPLSMDFDYANSSYLEKLQVLPNENLDHNIQFFVMCWCKLNKLSFENFWEWCKKKRDTEERYSKYLGYWNDRDYNVRRDYVDNILQMYYPRLKTTYNYVRYEDYLKVPKVPKKTLTENEYMNANDISHEGVTVLGVGCGRGKTECAIQLIKKNMEKRVLIIVPRITLSYDIHNRLEKANIEFLNYKSLKYGEYIGSADRLIISPCSLYKIPFNIEKYDIVIIDEFETLVDMFLDNRIHKNGNNNNLDTNWRKFIELIKESDKVLLMDAITTKKTHKLLKKLRLDYEYFDDIRPDFLEISRVARRISIDGKKENVMITEKRFFNMVMNDLKNGKKCFVYTPYKEGRDYDKCCIRGVMPLLKFFCDKLGLKKGKDIEGYYAEAYEEKLGLRNVNKTWEKMKCIITNTCNSVGINYENFDFDNIYLFISSWNNIRDVLQVLRRIRHIKNKTITIYYEPKKKGNIFLKSYPHVEDFYEEFRELIRCDLLERQNYSKESFYMLCKQNGITSSDDIDPQLEDLIKFEKNDDYRITYDTINDVDYETCSNLVKKYEGGLISLTEKYEIEKYKFKLKYITTDIDKLKEIWINRDYCNKFDELYNINNHVINKFLKANDISIFDKSFDEFPINGLVPFDFDIRGLDFIDKFKYKFNIINYGQYTYTSIINAYFGNVLKPVRDSFKKIGKKQYQLYETDSDFINTLKLYKEYSRNYKNREVCLISEEIDYDTDYETYFDFDFDSETE